MEGGGRSRDVELVFGRCRSRVVLRSGFCDRGVCCFYRVTCLFFEFGESVLNEYVFGV